VLEKIATVQQAAADYREDIDGRRAGRLVVNKLRGVLNVCAVKAPAVGDRRKAILGDIAR